MWQQRRPAQPPPLAVVKAFRKWRATLTLMWMWIGIGMWLWLWQQASLLNCLAKQKPPFNRSPSPLQALLCCWPVFPPPPLPVPLPSPDFRSRGNNCLRWQRSDASFIRRRNMLNKHWATSWLIELSLMPEFEFEFLLPTTPSPSPSCSSPSFLLRQHTPFLSLCPSPSPSLNNVCRILSSQWRLSAACCCRCCSKVLPFN